MLSVEAIVEKAKANETEAAESVGVSAPVVSPLGSRYFRGDTLTNTATIEFAVAVSSVILEQQGYVGDVIPLDFIIAVHHEIQADFDLPDLKNSRGSARKRVISHMTSKHLADVQSASVSCTYTDKALPAVPCIVLTEDTYSKLNDVLYDFPLS